MNDNTPSPWRALSMFGAIGIDWAVCIVAGAFGGRWLDDIMGTEPIFLIIGLLCGVIAATLVTFLIIKRYMGDNL